MSRHRRMKSRTHSRLAQKPAHLGSSAGIAQNFMSEKNAPYLKAGLNLFPGAPGLIDDTIGSGYSDLGLDAVIDFDDAMRLVEDATSSEVEAEQRRRELEKQKAAQAGLIMGWSPMALGVMALAAGGLAYFAFKK